MAIERFYKPMKLLTASSNPDGRGGDVITYTEADIDGLVTLASSGELELANKLSIEATHTFYCDTSVSIAINDMIKWYDETYKIASEPQDTVKRGHHFKTMVKKVING